MNELINELVGKPVTVRSGYANYVPTENGILEAYDHPWLKLKKSNGETLLFSVYRIHTIKLLP